MSVAKNLTFEPARLRLLVISLGNQQPYYNCLHSAGHFALSAAQRALAPEQPSFMFERRGKKTSAVSTGPRFIFAQSPMMMNNCGPWISAAWKDTLGRENIQPHQLPLVLVHDELEADFGVVKLRNWESSARGHNGVKSAREAMGATPKSDRVGWSRITIGIGRPADRTSDVVSDYVLSPISETRKTIISDDVGPTLADHLVEIQKGLEAQWKVKYSGLA